MDMLAQWWYLARPRVDEGRRSSGTVPPPATRQSRFASGATAQQRGAVDAAVESTPGHLPALVEAVAATAVFDFGVYFGGADAETPRRRRRGRRRRKHSTRDAAAPGSARFETGAEGVPTWQPVRMAVSAARDLVGEGPLQRSLVGGASGAGSAESGAQSILEQIAAAQALPLSEARRRRLRRLRRVLRRQRQQVVAVRAAGAQLEQLEAWLLAAQGEVLEGVARCQQARSWVRGVCQLTGL